MPADLDDKKEYSEQLLNKYKWLSGYI
jgi:hypothetical protein